jgi:hypothetical protein
MPNMEDASRLSYGTGCKPAEPFTGARAGRFAAAVRGGPWAGLLRSRLGPHVPRAARSAMEH